MSYAVNAAEVPALLVRDNKVIGECFVCYMVDNCARAVVKMTDDRAKTLISNSEVMKRLADAEYIRPHFGTITGEYVGCALQGQELKEMNGIFNGVRIVDKNNFEMGTCPHWFKDVEGYRSFFS
jgi:hypothetical protein